MKKTGLILAATAAALFVAGCATPAEVAPAPVAGPVNACKGMSSCKAVKKHHRRHHRAAADQQQQNDTASNTDTTTQAN